MRISSYWKEYKKIEAEYRAKNCEVPASVKADYKAQEYLDSLWRLLNKCADGNAVSNATWEYLSKIQFEERDPDTSTEMEGQVDAAIEELAVLFADLREEKNGFLMDGNTLTRDGRKRVRASVDRIGRLNQ